MVYFKTDLSELGGQYQNQLHEHAAGANHPDLLESEGFSTYFLTKSAHSTATSDSLWVDSFLIYEQFQ